MPEYEPRRAEPGQRFEWRDEFGRSVRLAADDEGVLRPSSEQEKRLADAFGLPVARKVLAEDKAAKKGQEG